MTILQAIILGIVQGITEFLPVSSSAHLVLVPYWLGWNIPPDQVFAFDVIVQLGTLVAVIIYFWKDLWEILCAVVRGIIQGKPFEEQAARQGWLVVLATVPAGIFGMTVKPLIEDAFHSPMVTGLLLLVTAAMLIVGEMISNHSRHYEEINWFDALIIGIFQAVALFPGISRSGSTITGGLIRQLNRDAAARFSFLMSIPIMIAAGCVEGMHLQSIPSFGSFLPALVIGTITAGLVGFVAIKWLLAYLRKHSLSVFSIFCIVVWLITFIITINRG
jgi:undecaprenyl-diphosphatase